MSNYAKVNNECVNQDLAQLHSMGFLTHTNTNGNAPAYATEQDEEVFGMVQKASADFKATVANVANASVHVVTDLSTLNTITPITAVTEVPCVNATSISYLSKVGIMALKITDAVASGSNGQLKLSEFEAILNNAEYELLIGYFSDVASANIAIGIDLDGISPEAGDTAVAFQFVKDQEVLSQLNGAYLLQGNGTFKMVGVETVANVDVSGISTTVKKISILA